MHQVQAFTTKYPGRVNILHSQVKVAAAFDHKNPPSQPVAYKMCTAIWDTGATGSVISEKVAKDCNLAPISMAQVRHAGGISSANVFSVSFVLRNNVIIAEIEVTEGVLGDQVDVLIGMDIISHGDFAVTNKNNKTVFSFRLPSITEIDFIKDTPDQNLKVPKRSIEKWPRNQPCHCGSGKKYKRCCGR